MQEEPMATVLAPLPTSPDGVTADATGQAGALSDWYATADGTWRPSTCPSGWRSARPPQPQPDLAHHLAGRFPARRPARRRRRLPSAAMGQAPSRRRSYSNMPHPEDRRHHCGVTRIGFVCIGKRHSGTRHSSRSSPTLPQLVRDHHPPGHPPRHLPFRQGPDHRHRCLHRRLQRPRLAVFLDQERRRITREDQTVKELTPRDTRRGPSCHAASSPVGRLPRSNLLPAGSALPVQRGLDARCGRGAYHSLRDTGERPPKLAISERLYREAAASLATLSWAYVF